MVNLEWYRTFKLIYEKETLTAAAEALFISQPGVSLHLSALENHVGNKLFDRSGKKMLPTEKGKALYNALTEPMNTLLEIEEQFQRTAEKNTPTLNIGMCFETFQLILEKHLHTLDFNVVSRFADYKELLQKLEKGIIDLVVTPQRSNSKELEFIPFSQETIVLIGSRDIDEKEFNKQLKLDTKTLVDWLMQHKWYGTANDNEHFKRFWQANFKKAPSFRQNFVVPNFTSIIRAISMGSGLAIVPDFLCRKEVESNQIKLLWKGNKKICNRLYFAYRKNTTYRDQIDIIQKLFAEEMS